MKSKIKVGFLTERMILGFGVDKLVHKTALQLVEHGFEVTVFCIRNDGTYINEKYKIVEICLPLSGNSLKNEWNAIQALRRLNHEDIDIWVAETYPFYIATHILKKPVVCVDSGVCSTTGFSLGKKLFFLFMKWTQNFLFFPFAEKIINISLYTRAITPFILRSKQNIIYCGGDNYGLASEEGIAAFREKYKIKSSDIVLAYVGRLNHEHQPYKGTKELVEVYRGLRKDYPHAHLIMAGYGDAEDEKWLRSEGIIPLVNASDETISILYTITDIYLTASKWEGFNLPIAEAGLFKTPAVAYDVGAHREVLKKGSGFLVKTTNEFILKLRLLIEDRALRKSMSENAYPNAAIFSWKKSGLEYAAILRQIQSRQKLFQGEYPPGTVDVITLNHNGKKYLDALFASLKAQTYANVRVTMVDNASADGSVAYVKEKFPWVSVVVSKKNLFFSRGNNLAISKTTGEYIFLVNNDTVVHKDAINQMVKTIEEKNKYRIAAVAAKMLFLNNTKIIDSIGTVITEDGFPFNRGIGQVDIGQYDQVEEVFGACFGAVLLRRVVYKKIVGPLDDDYFGYFEDVDWCYRARLMGYKIYSCPQAVVYHDHSGTTKNRNYNWKYYLIQRNLIRTMIKNFETKSAIKKSVRHIIGLSRHFFATKEKGRKAAVARIVLNSLLFLPIFLVKRAGIQRKRCLSDYECFKFQHGEHPAFDPIKYEPSYTLDSLEMMFSRLEALKKSSDKILPKMISKIVDLNQPKYVIPSDDWERLLNSLAHDLEPYLGEKYTGDYISSILLKRKKPSCRLEDAVVTMERFK